MMFANSQLALVDLNAAFTLAVISIATSVGITHIIFHGKINYSRLQKLIFVECCKHVKGKNENFYAPPLKLARVLCYTL